MNIPECSHCYSPATVEIVTRWKTFVVCAQHVGDMTRTLLEEQVEVIEFKEREDWEFWSNYE